MCNITRDTSTCEKQYKSLIALHQQSLTEDKAHLIFNNDCVKSWWIIPLIQEDKIKLILVSRNAMIYSKQHTTAATSNSMYEYYQNFCLLSPWHAYLYRSRQLQFIPQLLFQKKYLDIFNMFHKILWTAPWMTCHSVEYILLRNKKHCWIFSLCFKNGFCKFSCIIWQSCIICNYAYQTLIVTWPSILIQIHKVFWIVRHSLIKR